LPSKVPKIRIRAANNAPVRTDGNYVLYWMIANRRLCYNFSLDRALEHCEALAKPLLIFEGLRVGYRWASDRLHRFVIDGMADNAETCAAHGVRYFPYIEPRPDQDKGLLAALAEEACVIVTDEFPCFFLPRMVASAAKQSPVLLEAVDSNGLFPIYAADHDALRAFDFRRILQKELPPHLSHFPNAEPLSKQKSHGLAIIPSAVLHKWPIASPELFNGSTDALSDLPIDHSVTPTALRGGPKAASSNMKRFLEQRFPDYLESRNDPDHDATSGFSPYLHFGHLSAHELFTQIARRERWTPEKLSLRTNGSREGWWNMSPTAEAFLDQLITWRELGYNFTAHRADYDCYDSLPNWAKSTLQKHLHDEREHVYTLEEFETASTHDSLWNAAQLQIVREGRIHNYLRMLWGKKILEWTRRPQQALQIMIHLNNKYGIDGRNPNSYSGIFWILGRYDRPWGPERPIFGTVRYMSSANTARKTHVKAYLQKFSATPSNEASSLPLFETPR
jgi:deoxyribodipyrimidine photo-lyase